MPAVSRKQQAFMGAELARKRAGKKTQTGMSESQLKDFASTKTKGLPVQVKGHARHKPKHKEPKPRLRYE